MEKEFNLSEKIFGSRCQCGFTITEGIRTEDIKEFIKILLEAEREGLDMKEVIINYAGDKLT